VVLNDVLHQLVNLDTGLQHSLADFVVVVVFRLPTFGDACDEDLVI
jgi:hypothetical protein